jgi:hypothetical protein
MSTKLTRPILRCGHITSKGNKCNSITIKGLIPPACRIHCGLSKTQRKDKVAEILAGAALPASNALLEILDQWLGERCEHCGHPTGEPGPVIKAAQIVLDRTGFHPTLTLQSGGRAVDPEMERIASYLTTEQLIQVHEWIEDARRRIEQSVPIIDVVPITEAALTVHRPTEPEE